MLNMNKTVTLNGSSIFDNVTAQGYQAAIDSETPENISLSNWIGDYTTYKAHRGDCATERTQFEDAAFKLQEEMINEKKKVSLPE